MITLEVRISHGKCHCWEGKSQASPILTSAHSIAVELAPPVLNLNVKENFIHVSASFPLPTCVENLTWKYDLNLWEAGSKDKVSKSGSSWMKGRN